MWRMERLLVGTVLITMVTQVTSILSLSQIPNLLKLVNRRHWMQILFQEEKVRNLSCTEMTVPLLEFMNILTDTGMMEMAMPMKLLEEAEICGYV